LELVVKQQNKAKPKPKVVKTEENMLVSGDQDKLVSILGHLVQNAQEATQENGSVSLSLYKLDSRAIIEVTDTGCGMDSRFIRERLFRPFDTTKGNAGMGIGVFEARQLVTTYGGQMEVESEPNKGTRFTLRLPLAKQALENKRNERDVV
jgi:signal transduction histidine kinase